MGAGAGPLHRPQISENSPLPSTTRYPYEYVNKMIFSLRKRRFQKKNNFWNLPVIFFHIPFFPLMRRWGLGEEVLKKVEKKTFILLPCLKQMSKHMSDSSLAIFSNIRRIKIQN